MAEIQCRICRASYKTAIHHLTEPIDVYCQWIDAANEAQDNEKPLAEEEVKEIEDALDDAED